MQLKCYPLMCEESQRCMRREKWRWGRTYTYTPKPNLIRRLSAELNMSADEVREQIAKEREFILKNKIYYV
jgi:hypothetical protein